MNRRKDLRRTAAQIEQARREAGQGINTVPAEQVIPGWAELVATHASKPA
jgi:hypothetical protein